MTRLIKGEDPLCPKCGAVLESYHNSTKKGKYRHYVIGKKCPSCSYKQEIKGKEPFDVPSAPRKKVMY